ncbi:C40 family peptidase [Streptomyces sp. HC44]|uniref:C40 family peptidase n=1 Tax=Streptomyces scabichelini TaxID=2711217 RepID=A0A6G4VGR9_9ACTN|nr:peptidoglycan-binding protein [Streptomyces scabichelini]NGO12973.1 C40 family peptidase [Streptomyces scabichelini]
MAAPAFEEFEPASDCDCPGCVHRRRVTPNSPPGGFAGHGAGYGALVLAAAVLGAGQAVPAVAAAAHAPQRPGVPTGDEPGTPQGPKAPLHGPGGVPAKAEAPPTTRTEIIDRAKKWVAAQVPYSMSAYWSDGYRQDCSGFVSMAWNLGGNEWTGSLDRYGVRISKGQLKTGDILLFHNPADPHKGSHVVIFGGWADSAQTYYVAYEEARPHARKKATPYAYWRDSDRYLAYRYKGLQAAAAPGTPASAASSYPGAAAFGPGAVNEYVTRLGRQLVKKGFGKHYTSGPGPRWGEADRRNAEAFQRSQGWRGGAADGYPGPETWRRLFS